MSFIIDEHVFMILELGKNYNGINRWRKQEIETFAKATYETSKIPVPNQQFRKHLFH